MVMNYSMVLMRAITVDYGRDKGVPMAHGELLATYSAATDLLLGHFGVPLLADRGYISRTMLAALVFAFFSAMLFTLPAAHGIAAFTATYIVLSMFLAATVSLGPVLIVDYLGVSWLPFTCGASGLVTGPLLLATASITGKSNYAALL
ncbi:hypothetical protein HPB48_026836 [Haemaphysalis longicornis]|uniref:Monocarboxylate transporter n=1 Tax=Haemaphysalis longicornis TaxID=44386 RepID=A0A9J6HCI4_HAELO|nr:hypothetical protein HPB48_026836 [Haemaphysalis longicornis]